MRVTENVNGKDKTDTYKAKDADELKKKSPEAYKLYEKYGQGPQIQAGIGNIQIQGIAVPAGQIQIGVPIQAVPLPGNLQPPPAIPQPIQAVPGAQIQIQAVPAQAIPLQAVPIQIAPQPDKPATPQQEKPAAPKEDKPATPSPSVFPLRRRKRAASLPPGVAL